MGDQDGIYKALSDPTRRQILRLLGSAGELKAGDIARQFDMTAPSISHHFNVLKAAGLIYSRREGQQILYSLNTTVIQDALAWVMELTHKSSPGEEK